MFADFLISVVFIIVSAVALWYNQDAIDEWRKEL